MGSSPRCRGGLQAGESSASVTGAVGIAVGAGSRGDRGLPSVSSTAGAHSFGREMSDELLVAKFGPDGSKASGDRLAGLDAFEAAVLVHRARLAVAALVVQAQADLAERHL